jgi:hypothetical protein
MMSDYGIVYLATGSRYLKQCFFSAKNVKKKCKNISTTLITDKKITNKYLNNVKIAKFNCKRHKQDYLFEKSPYDYSLYLDTDTKVVYSILEVFEILNKFDIALVQDFSRKNKRWSKVIKDYDNIPYSFPEYCGGVILFKKTKKVEQFFKLWKELFYKYNNMFKEVKNHDQPSLRVSLWNSDLRIHTLPIEYNIRSEDNRRKWDKRIKSGIEDDVLRPRIFHWQDIDKKNSKIKPHIY